MKTFSMSEAGANIAFPFSLNAPFSVKAIQIDNVTYEFDTLPAGSTIDLQKETFPIMVKLDWQLSTKSACPDKKIDILRIVKQ